MPCAMTLWNRSDRAYSASTWAGFTSPDMAANSATSSAVAGISFGTTTAQFISRFEWVSSAPLGLPVVPEV